MLLVGVVEHQIDLLGISRVSSPDGKGSRIKLAIRIRLRRVAVASEHT